MSHRKPLQVVFYWHMHQPFYRDAEDQHYHLPWVYLHAMKEYTDMAVVLERVPEARAVVNFVPSLMAQLAEYAAHIQAFLDGAGESMHDPLLDMLAASPPYSPQQRAFMLQSCFRLQHERNLHRYAKYSRLWALAEHHRQHFDADGDTMYIADQFFTDLLVWYHLGWVAETARDEHYVARRLLAKGEGFDAGDRRDLLTLIGSLLADVPVRYKRLQQAGKIELSTTPYAHPIIPLMLDFHTARQTVPDALLPSAPYPGGEARARDHIELARKHHEASFGAPAAGCWPAEGAVSNETLALLADSGFRWCATGEGVLHHSLACNVREHKPEANYQPWLAGVGERRLPCFFRDDHLSDLIGFQYKNWATDDAVANLMHELSLIRERTSAMETPVVSIIMDGENAWEHYYENGIPFLTKMYEAIAAHPDMQMTTFSDYLATAPAPAVLDSLVAGSWVYGNLSTWIGDRAKTQGWELLVQAKQCFDRVFDTLPEAQQAAALAQLRICEGSDWFWWFGDYNPSDVVRDFDRLYRQHLRRLYTLLGETPPETLDVPVSSGGGEAEGGGTMRRGNG